MYSILHNRDYGTNKVKATHYSLKAVSLKPLLVWEWWVTHIFQGCGRWMRSLWLPGSCSWVNQPSHPLNDLLQQSSQNQEGIIYEAKLILFRSFHSCIFLYLTVCMHAKSIQSCLTLCDTWAVTHRVPLFMGFSRQEYWNGLPFPLPVDLPDLGIELTAPTFEVNSLPLEPPGKRLYLATREWKAVTIG